MVPTITDDVNRMKRRGMIYNSNSKSSLTQYLNRIRFYYVPAIKDNSIFSKTIDRLSDTLLNTTLSSDEDLSNALSIMNQKISLSSKALNDEYEKVTKIKSELAAPQGMKELYHSMKVNTVFEGNDVSLDKRGDGIRVRYLPSILHYIAKYSKECIIWGFEEPENSLEYNLSEQMAQDFQRVYARESQIFVTSHSPAFISLDEMTTTKIYRCFNDDGSTSIMSMADASIFSSLAEELGYVNLQKKLYKEYQAKKVVLEQRSQQIERLYEELEALHKPVIYTEGKTDVAIIKTAWEKLYSTDLPFEVKSCNTMPENESMSCAGCEMLVSFLNSVRFDTPHLVIGLFDNDDAGKKSFNNLDRSYKPSPDGMVKKHTHQKSYAILLPIPDGKSDFEQFGNLCIEYYFNSESLSKKVDGYGLEFTKEYLKTFFRGKEIKQEIATEPYFKKIKESTKNYFATKIVPTLSKEEFINFQVLFDRILRIIYMNKLINIINQIKEIEVYEIEPRELAVV